MNDSGGTKQNSVVEPSLGVIPKRSSRNILDYWNSFDSALHRPARTRGAQANKTVGSMARLWKAMRSAERVLVITRGLREPRATLTGNLIAFDRYWNLILSHVTECSVELEQSILTGHGRPGRSKRRRQQRLTNILKRSGHLLNPHIPGNVRTIRELYQVDRRRRRWEPLEISKVIPSIHKEQQDRPSNVSCSEIVRGFDSANQEYAANCFSQAVETEVQCPSVRPSTSFFLLRTTADAQLRPSSEQQRAPKVERQARQLNTRVSHHAQLFIRGANIIYVSFLKENNLIESDD